MYNLSQTTNPLLPPRLSAAWTSFAAVATSCASAAIALVGLLGALPGVSHLTANICPMSIDAACAMLLLGTSLALVCLNENRWGRPARMLAWAALLVPAVSAARALASWQWPFSSLGLAAPGASARSAMEAPVLAAVSLCAAAILLLNKIVARKQSLAQWLGAAAAVLGLLELLGHLFGIAPAASIPTAVAILTLAVGIILARPRLKPAAIFWSGGATGVIARRLVLPVIMTPTLLAGFALWAVEGKFLDSAMAATVFGLLGVLFLAALTGWCVSALAGMDMRRGRALRNLRSTQQSLVRSRDELERRVNERTAELTVKNAELHRRSYQLARLASELTLAEQRERKRLAHVLHDHLQQLLVSAKLGLEVYLRRDGQSLPPDLRRVQDLLVESITSSRELTMELFPPVLHEEGLGGGLRWLAAWMQEKHSLCVELQADLAAVPASQDLSILLFQSARELLFNIVKHANVKTAQVCLRRQNSHLELTVCDRGTGFDPNELLGAGGAGFGLFSVRERLELLGGAMEIESAPGRGSRVTLRAPCGQGLTAEIAEIGTDGDPGNISTSALQR